MALSLSPRQHEILQMIAAGLTNRQIAKRLKIKHNTVKIHRGALYMKLHAHNRQQVLSRGERLGIVKNPAA